MRSRVGGATAGSRLRVAVLLPAAFVAWLFWWLVARGVGEADPVWQQMQTTRTWSVGIDPSFPPFAYTDERGEMVGFDVDLAHAIAATWGLTITWHSIGFDSLYEAVRAGRVAGAISALPAEPRLAREVAYSAPYFEAGLLWVHADAAASLYDRPEDVSGRRVAVEEGSEAEAFVRRWNRRLAAGRPPGRIALVRFATPAAALDAVRQEVADVALVDAVSAWQGISRDGRLRIAPQPAEPSPYVVVLPITAPQLQREVNRALDTLRQSGRLAALHQKWFGALAGTGQ